MAISAAGLDNRLGHLGVAKSGGGARNGLAVSRAVELEPSEDHFWGTCSPEREASESKNFSNEKCLGGVRSPDQTPRGRGTNEIGFMKV